jgi:hypothetical protein
MTDWNQMAAGSSAFQWLPGMRTVGGYRVSGGHETDVFLGAPGGVEDGALVDRGLGSQLGRVVLRDELPDLADAGTQGAVLFGLLVPAGWTVTLSVYGVEPRMGLTWKGRPPHGGTVPEALARALAATP